MFLDQLFQTKFVGTLNTKWMISFLKLVIRAGYSRYTDFYSFFSEISVEIWVEHSRNKVEHSQAIGMAQ